MVNTSNFVALVAIVTGFVISTASGANYDFYVNGTSGSVHSNNYPARYPMPSSTSNPDTWRWIITVPGEESRVLIKFEDLSLGSSTSYFDRVSLYHGNSTAGGLLAGPFQQQNLPTQVFLSNGNQLMVDFNVRCTSSYCSSSSIRGFLTSFETVTSTVDVEDTPSGIVESPNFPDPYNPAETILTTISHGPGSLFSLVRLELAALDTEECCDSLEIYDGASLNSRQVVRYSGNPSSPFPVIISTGRALTLFFRSDLSVTGYGFHAKFYPGTQFSVNGLTGSFTNVNYPGYTPMLTEQWLIALPDSSKRVWLSIKHISTEFGKDFVRFFDGETTLTPMLAEYSGNVTGSPMPQYLSSTSKMLIQFTTDGGGPSLPGFAVIYEAVDSSFTTTAAPTTEMFRE